MSPFAKPAAMSLLLGLIRRHMTSQGPSLVNTHAHIYTNHKGAITSKIKHAIKHETSPARLAQLLQPSSAFCLSLQPMLMRAETVVRQLCKSCRTCFKFYCMFYFTCDRSFILQAVLRRFRIGHTRLRIYLIEKINHSVPPVILLLQ